MTVLKTRAEINKAYYQKNKAKILKQKKEYNNKTKKERATFYKKYTLENKEKLAIYKKKYFSENRSMIEKKRKEKVTELTVIEKRKYNKEYGLKNKDFIRDQKKDYARKRYQIDPVFKIKSNLKSRVGMLIRGGKINKKVSKTKFAMDMLGTSIEELIKYIEKKWHPHPITNELMTWKNHAVKGWHIDHIKPVSKFNLTKLSEQKKCFNYKNLQPLWAEENLKKSAKY